MKLWFLQRIHERTDYDVKNGAVVRAETEEAAREMVALEAWNEGAATWRDPSMSSCAELKPNGAPGIVLEDNRPG